MFWIIIYNYLTYNSVIIVLITVSLMSFIYSSTFVFDIYETHPFPLFQFYKIKDFGKGLYYAICYIKSKKFPY